jgi:chemotaxis protein MotB
MAHKKKKPDDGGPGGAPEWMVTFSDCMTLLLTFFVLLLSFSSFDDKLFRDTMVIISQEFAVNKPDKGSKEAVLPTDTIKYDKDYYKGSEKPTLIKGDEFNIVKEENETEDFHDRKIFLIPSNDIFMGRGNIISAQGRRALSEMAPFIKEIPNRIVISENSQKMTGGNKRSGLERAWAVTEYFTTKLGLSKQQFSISAASTVTGSSRINKSDRILEIVFLERSIYN